MTINLLCLSHGGFHLSPCFRRLLTLLFDDVMSADLLNSVPLPPAEITFGLHDASGCLCVFCIGLTIRESFELCVIWLRVRCVLVCGPIYMLKPESL